MLTLRAALHRTADASPLVDTLSGFCQSTAMIFEFLQIFFENVTRPSIKGSCTGSL